MVPLHSYEAGVCRSVPVIPVERRARVQLFLEGREGQARDPWVASSGLNAVGRDTFPQPNAHRWSLATPPRPSLSPHVTCYLTPRVGVMLFWREKGTQPLISDPGTMQLYPDSCREEPGR